MGTMVSLRLSERQQQRLAEAARRSGKSRSEWLRQVIERELEASAAARDPHAEYLRLMPPAGAATAPTDDAAARHSERLKAKMRGADRR